MSCDQINPQPICNFDLDELHNPPKPSSEVCKHPSPNNSCPITNLKKPCASRCTNVKVKCKSVPNQSKADQAVDSYHPDIRIQNYLYHENNRLYCHGIFNKAGKRVMDVERNNPKHACFFKMSDAQKLARENWQAERCYKKWMENHERRNAAYASNPLAPFYTDQLLRNGPFYNGDARQPRMQKFFKKPC